ncbi:MAG: 4-oxalocrotonate tautomerase [Clostridium sp.]|nr:4-oxalocrotonate tautomerase [Clostridium sp.]
MEKRKNLCAMIPETLYAQVCSEKEQLELTLSQYVERILKEHFEGGKAMANGTRTLAFQVSEELFTRIKEHLKKTGQSQKDFVITLIEQALQDAERNEEEVPEQSEEKTE